MAAVASPPPSSHASAANFDFDLPAADANTKGGEGGASSSSSASVTLDVTTNNFDGPSPPAAADRGSREVTTDESHHTAEEEEEGDDDDDGDSHFSDVAQLAARAMESVDMDRLCSELFTQEMLTHEELEEAVACAQAAVGAERAEALAAASTAHSAQVTSEGAGVVTSPHPAQGQRDGPAAAAGGSVPSTIAVPSKTAEALQRPQPSPKPRGDADTKVAQAGLSPSQPKAPPPSPAESKAAPAQPNFPTKAVPQGSSIHGFAPQGQAPPASMNSHAQFSQPRGMDISGPQAKRQRFDHAHTEAALRANPGQFHGPPSPSGHVNRSNAPSVPPILPGKVPSPLPTPQDAPTARCGAASKAQAPAATCARCHYPGADVRIRCPSGCACHARCLDLVAVCQDVRNHGSGPEDAEVCVRNCPHCAAPARGMEVLPLDFAEMDRVQEAARAAFLHSGLLGSGGKRSHDAAVGGDDVRLLGLPTSVPSHSGAHPRQRGVQCYDPSHPRTGRWTDEEIAYRDALISHFLGGGLPLANGLKLNDFLPAMLKSKQSRLAKKMKHAKLSTKYFHPKAGCVAQPDAARQLSRLERDFVASVPDPVERSEIQFHMEREWRDHFAARCRALSVRCDGTAWRASVEDADRRLAFERERHRRAKRKVLMGKAMATDLDPATGRARERGVFVRDCGAAGGYGGRDDFELVVERSVSNSAGTNGGTPPVSVVDAGGKDKGENNAWTSGEPNFKRAAPFLAGIASYVERNGVPFEHVDVWVPSRRERGSSTGNFRLCYGGSVTMGVQIVIVERPERIGTASGASSPTLASGGASSPPGPPSPPGCLRREPLPPEEKQSLALFGDYSEKFSFDPGCGLPGRTFESGLPAWERRLSGATPGRFERRGGAAQFGVQTAVALPVDSPNVGRVVLVLYSKHDRARDEGLLARLTADLRLLNPCPRWKLVVDVDGVGGAADGTSSLQAPPPDARGSPVHSSTSAPTRQTSVGSTVSSSIPQADAASPKEKQIKDLILLLGENIPSDMNSLLGQQLQGIMSLRLILLRGNARTPEEEQLVDTILVLFESYVRAGRSRSDIAVMVARDFSFHLQMERNLAARYSTPACPVPAPGPAVGQAPAPSMYSMNVARATVHPHLGAMMVAGYGANPMMAYHAAQQQYARQTSNGAASPRSNASR